MRYLTISLLICLSGVVTAQQFAPSMTVSAPAVDRSKVKIVQNLGGQVPLTAQFKDVDGSPVTFGQLDTVRPVVVLPVFYRCQGVCNLEFQNLTTLLDKDRSLHVGKDFDVVILSIDPTEGPDLAKGKLDDAKKQFPTLFTGQGWHFLTGSLENIKAVTDALGFFYTYDAATDVINHPAGLMFVSPGGKVSSYILGPVYTSDAIRKDLDVAAKSQVGAKVQDAFFGCIHIDPLTGKRSLVLEKFVRVSGGFFLALMICGYVFISRKGKRMASE